MEGFKTGVKDENLEFDDHKMDKNMNNISALY